ncbi:sensor histidine kinase [Cohnella lupini]|uniref:histidine kinase n=1 Tax=Cohnella lupini TaxID=1294267 RepID=A0A3D9I0P6_9BACL|nr:HAMP domain-containing sensor histidine kinase [Cohnella lupini]RED54726.1 signal transduction histidine kinase [Cohnella lupini]
MFNSVHKRLVLLNVLVIVIVLAFLSSLLYAHMRYRLFHDTDEMLKQAELRLQQFDNLSSILQTNHPDSQQDERTTYLFWKSNGELIGQLPMRSFKEQLAARFQKAVDSPQLRTVTDDNRSYRVLNFTYRYSNEKTILRVGIVRSLEDAENTLHALQWDVALALLSGIGISIIAGFFLAGRALVPIRSAWDKQQRFVADASHELRTPITIIHVQTEVLLRHPSHSIEEESPSIAVILKECKRMNKLVDDLLTLARSDSNLLQIQSSTIALDVLLKEINSQFQLLANVKDIEIRADIQDRLSLWGDEGRIRQLLIILLDNALKYTPAHGKIELIARYQSHFVNISVKDTGFGIEKEDLPYIFDRFYRGNKARTHEDEGTGLGLSIAKWIVKVHDGVIRVESKLNVGTHFEMLFPRKKQYVKK